MELSKKNTNLRLSVLSMWGLSLIVLGFIFFTVGSTQKMFESKYSLYMFLPNIEQLNPGAFVTLSGLKVGIVGKLEFTKMNDQQGVLIELKIDKDFAAKITPSSKATVKTMGILGDKYIDISLGDLNEPALQAGTHIQSDPGVDANALIANATAALADLKELFHNANVMSAGVLHGSGLMGKVIADEDAGNHFDQILRNLRHSTEQIAQGQGTVGKMVQDTTLYSTLTSAARELEQITAKLNSKKGSLSQFAADTTFFARIKSVTLRTDSLLHKIQGEGTTGKLLTDQELYSQLVVLTKALNALIEDVQKHPQKYVSFKLF